MNLMRSSSNLLIGDDVEIGIIKRKKESQLEFQEINEEPKDIDPMMTDIQEDQVNENEQEILEFQEDQQIVDEIQPPADDQGPELEENQAPEIQLQQEAKMVEEISETAGSFLKEKLGSLLLPAKISNILKPSSKVILPPINSIHPTVLDEEKKIQEGDPSSIPQTQQYPNVTPVQMNISVNQSMYSTTKAKGKKAALEGWWAMDVGVPKEKQGDTLQEILNNNENDVYPMSIKYTRSQQNWMKIFRFITLFICFYFCVPFDLYIKSTKRIGYFGTYIIRESLSIQEIEGPYIFDLQNCEVNLLPNQESNIVFEFGIEYETQYSFNKSMLQIKANPTQTCIVNLQMPQNQPLPQMAFNFSGHQDNIILDDSKLNGISLNFSQGLNITGDTVFITLHNHEMPLLKIELLYSICKLYGLRADYKDIYFLTGLYSERLPFDYHRNMVRISQPEGNICIYAPEVWKTNSSNCQIITNSSFVQQESEQKLCLINAFVCNNPFENCTDTDIPVDSITKVVLRDGPIQIRYDNDIISDSFIKIQSPNKKIKFSQVSNNALNISLTNYLDTKPIDIISVLQTIGVDYQRAWAYTNRVVYFQSQFWPLVWGSATLLSPELEYKKLVMIDNQCPARDDPASIDLEVRDFYFNYFPSASGNKLALVTDYSTFYEMGRNDFGNPVLEKININQNPLIISAIGVAAFIAVVGSLLLVQIAGLLYRMFLKRYSDWITQQKQFALTKKQARLGEQKGVAAEEGAKFEFQSQQKVFELRGLFKTQFQMIDSNQKKLPSSYNFSVFQIPTLYIDFMFRKYNNSLKAFIQEIPENKQQFSNIKMKQSPINDVSIQRSDFERYYSDFCQKYGYNEVNIDQEAQNVFKTYKLVLENQEGIEEEVYGNIRFKTMKEKNNTAEENNQQNMSTIQQFLQSECLQSQFDSDYIGFDVMKKAYNNFCQTQGIQLSDRQQIIGSQELLDFGSVIKNAPPPQRIIGIKFSRQHNQSKELPLIRIPSRNQNVIIAKLMRIDGFIPNAVVTIVHFLLIFAVPILIPGISFLAISTMTKIQNDIFKKPLEFVDFYSTNRLRPWWENCPHLDIFGYIHIYVLVFLVFAFSELISYYLTGFDNNGRFPIRYTIPKKILMGGFYICLGIYMLLYFAMFWFILVWAILAAILNPSKYLPYAAAALTLFSTIGVKIVFYKLKYEAVFKNFDRIISEKLSLVVEQSVQKLKTISKDKVSQINLPVGNETFQKAINSQLDSIGDNSSKSLFDMPKGQDLNDIQSLAKIVSQSLGGIHSSIIELSIAIIIRNKPKIVDGLRKLALELNIDYSLLEPIVEIVLSDFNPQQQNVESLGQVEVLIKKLFRKLVPRLNVESIGKLDEISILGETSSLIDYFDQYDGIYSELFKLIIYYQYRDKAQIKRQVISLLKSLTGQENEQASKVFEILQFLADGELQILMDELNKLDGNNQTAQLLGFKNNFPILFMIGFSRRSSTISSYVINQCFKEIFALNGMMRQQEKQDIMSNYQTNKHIQSQSERIILALYLIVKGEVMDMRRISSIVQKKGPFNGDLLSLINAASQNSPQSFEQIIYKIGLTSEKDILLEFYNIIQQKRINAFNICNKLVFPVDKTDVLTSLIQLLFYIIKYEVLYDKKKEAIKNKKNNADQTKIEFQIICTKVLENIQILIDEEELDLLKYKQLVMFLSKAFRKETQNSLNNEEDHTENNNLLSENSQRENQHNSEQIPEENKNQQLDLSNLEEVNKLKKIMKCIFAIPTHKSELKTYHIELWRIITEDPVIKKYLNDEILAIVRCYAFISLRNDGLITQNDPNYIKCVKTLAEHFEIEYEKIDFLIDIISGYPLDIFRVSPKTPSYNIQNPNQPKFIGNFDNQRLNLLCQLFDSQKNLVQYSCIQWYHYYRFFKQGKATIPLFMKLFNIKIELIELLAMSRQNQSEDRSNFNNHDFLAKIHSYLKSGILHKKKKGAKAWEEKKDQQEQKYYKITQRHFVSELDISQLNTNNSLFLIQETPQIEPNQIMPFLESLNKLMLLKQCDKKVIKEVMGFQDNENDLNQVLITILQGVKAESTASSLIALASNLAKHIEFFEQSTIQKPLKNIIGLQKITKQQQNLFIQLILTLNLSQFQSIYRQKNNNKIQLEKSLQYLIHLANDAHQEFKNKNFQEIEEVDESEFQIILQVLYENNYFNDIAPKLFSFIDDRGLQLQVPGFQNRNLSDKICCDLMGLFIGSALSDYRLLRYSAISLLDGHELNLSLLEGLAAALMQDTESEMQIKRLAQQLELDGQYLVNLIDYINKDTKNLPQILSNLLCNLPVDQAKVCSSIIHIMKGDIPMIKGIAEKINVDSKQLIPVIAAASGDLNILSEYYSELAEKLSLNSQNSVRYLSELAHGKTECIYQLSQKRSKNFNIFEPDLTESIFNITCIGKRIMNKEITLKQAEKIGSIETSISNISRKLQAIFNLNNEQGSKLKRFITIICKSCWKDQISIQMLAKKLQKVKSNNSIWYNPKDGVTFKLNHLSERGIYKFLRRSLKQVNDESDKVKDQIFTRQKKLITIMKNILLPGITQLIEGKQPPTNFSQALKEHYSLIQDEETQKNEKELNDNLLNSAFQIGCSFGLGLYKKFSQPFYYCLDCNLQIDDENIGICQICAIFCHAGHKLQAGNFGQNTKILCDCGQGKYLNCSNLNSKNPIVNCRGKRNCSVMRQNFKAIQEKAIIKIFGSIEDFDKGDSLDKTIIVSESEDNYKSNEFLEDLTDAFDLPNYFDGEINRSIKEALITKNVLKINTKGTQFLTDVLTSLKYCLAQNIILMAQGSISKSFLTILSCKKQYNPEDFQNQTLYPEKNQEILSKTTSIFRTMCCFVAIAQEDSSKFQEFGDGLCEALGETGNKELTALDKLQNIFKISKGGKLPHYQSYVSQSIKKMKKNSYLRLFERFYGNHAIKVMLIHKLLQLTEADLLLILLGIDNDLKKKELNEDQKNIQQWIEKELFDKIMQFDDKAKFYFKHIIGLLCKNIDSLDYITREQKIPASKAAMYKAILTSDQKDLIPIFENLKRMIPVEFNLFMIKVWEGDPKSIVQFVIEFLERNNQLFKSWKDFKSFKKDTDLKKKQYTYLSNLYALMSGEVMEAEHSIDQVLKRIMRQDIFDNNELNDREKRMYNCIVSVHGVFYSSILDIPDIAHSINRSDRIDLVSSLVNIMNKSWTNSDIKKIINQLSIIDLQQNKFVNQYKCLLLALEGDLISLCKLDDEVLVGDGSHTRSLLASLVTGTTKFDHIEESVKTQQQQIQAQRQAKKMKNLLLREMYRMYERAIRIQFSSSQEEQKIDDFLTYSFQERIPLHILMLLTEDRNFVDKLFDPCVMFSVNLNRMKSNGRKYIKTFLDFMDPYTQNSNIRTILKQALNVKALRLQIKKVQKVEMFSGLGELKLKKKIGVNMNSKLVQNLFKELAFEDAEDHIKVDMLNLSKLLSNCYQMDQSSVLNLYQILIKLFDNEQIFQNNLNLVQKLLKKERYNIFENLAGVVAMMMAQVKKIEGKQFDTQDALLIQLISKWMHGISIMLDKENALSNNDLARQVFAQAIKSLMDYYGDRPHILSDYQDNILYLIDVVVGLISLCKQNFQNIKPLALKIGGFPNVQKLVAFFDIIKKNKGSFNVEVLSGIQNVASYTPLQDQIPTTQVESGGLSTGMDPKQIFDYFARKNYGKIGIEEFRELCKYMGIKLTPSQQIQIFSKVDDNQSGTLELTEFLKAFFELKQMIILESVQKVGLSINDLVISFVVTIFILLLMFAFIFIGIAAFSPASSFSSVTNSILPLCAGGAVNKGGDDQQKDEDLKEVVDENIA